MEDELMKADFIRQQIECFSPKSRLPIQSAENAKHTKDLLRQQYSNQRPTCGKKTLNDVTFDFNHKNENQM